jgi:hypothetical protein
MHTKDTFNFFTAMTRCFLCAGVATYAHQKSTKPTAQVLPSGKK